VGEGKQTDGISSSRRGSSRRVSGGELKVVEDVRTVSRVERGLVIDSRCVLMFLFSIPSGPLDPHGYPHFAHHPTKIRHRLPLLRH
jgi:hypothetical protein